MFLIGWIDELIAGEIFTPPSLRHGSNILPAPLASGLAMWPADKKLVAVMRAKAWSVLASSDLYSWAPGGDRGLGSRTSKEDEETHRTDLNPIYSLKQSPAEAGLAQLTHRCGVNEQ